MIIGKHIDVYTEVGLDARKEAFRITGSNYSICVLSNALTLSQKNILEDFNFDLTNNQNWIKNIFRWYVQDQVSENDLLNVIKFLINQGIIKMN